MNTEKPNPDPEPRLPQRQARELAKWLLHCHSHARRPAIYRNHAAQQAMAHILRTNLSQDQEHPITPLDAREPAIQPTDLHPAARQLRCWADSPHLLPQHFQRGLPHPAALRALAQTIEDFLDSPRTNLKSETNRRPK